MKKKPPEEITQAELARRLGVTQQAINKAVRDGRISLLRNGRVVYEIALAEWRANTDMTRSKVRFLSEDQPKVKREKVGRKSEVVSDEALTKIKSLLREQGIDTNGPLTLQLARTAEVISRTSMREFELAVKRREFVPLAHVQKHIERIAISLKQSLVNLPARHGAQMAAALGVDQIELTRHLDNAIRSTMNEFCDNTIPASDVGGVEQKEMEEVE